MPTSTVYSRLNLYLDHPDLREKIKIPAARRRTTLSAYCLGAIRRRLIEDGLLPAPEDKAGPATAAEGLDRLRRQIGPIGVSVRELIAEGRRS